MTPSTLFYPGSTTKSFTAAAVSLLIDDTVNSSTPLTWQTQISSIIREDFVLPDEYSTFHVTLEDALSHRTGMPRHDFSYGGPNFTVRDAVRSLRYLPLTAEIRTKFQYCNLMYVVVSHAIETITKRWLGDVLFERIWKPLGMFNTFFSLEDAEAAVSAGKASLARGYMWLNKTQEYAGVPYIDETAASGAGAVISNVLDYAKWLQCMMTMSPPLSQAGHAAVISPRIHSMIPDLPPFTGPESYGLGWQISIYRNEPLIWHGGGLTGFGAAMGYLPRRQWGVAMMGNTAGTSNFVQQILVFQLIDDLLSTPESERYNWTASFEEALEQKNYNLRHAEERLYPDAPKKEDTLALSLPLKSYTGLYSHPGYRNITLTLVNKNETFSYSGPSLSHSKQLLHADVLDRTWPQIINLHHVSGDYFLGHARFAILSNTSEASTDYLSDWDNMLPAEFRIGSNGKVTEMGLGNEPEMGKEKLWFRKI